MAASPTSDVKALLTELHDTPKDSNEADDTILGPIFAYLMAVSPTPSQEFHWFCDQADSTTVAAATFLLRLFAYNGKQIVEWKERLQTCLRSCASCIRGLEEAKVTSKHTYFGAFSPDILSGFFQSFEEWELTMVLQDLTRAGFDTSTPVQTTRTLADAPVAVVYRMISNWVVFCDSRIQTIIDKYPPVGYLSGWPNDIVPPGMLVLVLHGNSHVRHWALAHATTCAITPMLAEKFMGAYSEALEVISRALTTSDPATSNNQISPFAFVSEPSELWAGFLATLRLIPVESLKSNPQQHVDFRRIVTGHLHDTGSHFAEILRCLQFLLKRLGDSFWVGEGPEYPCIVFDAVKDNPSFADLLQNIDPTGERPWFLAWFAEYLHTIAKLDVFGEVFAKMSDFLCEELQHERFKDSRPVIMDTTARVLLSVFHKSQQENFPHRAAVLAAFDIHADVLVGVAYSRDYTGDKWANARMSARSLVMAALRADIKNLKTVITRMCEVATHIDRPDRKGQDLLPLSIRKQMWLKLYPYLTTQDADGITSIICVIAEAAHLDVLRKRTFESILKLQHPGGGYSSGEQAVDEFNKALVLVRDGFLVAMSRFADCGISSAALDVFSRPGVVKAVMMLLLSPIDDLQAAAQTLIGLAFDVDVRLDCFRALLENLPDAALDGIFEFLSTFILYAPSMPEACSVSKSLVRCLTDVIDVLCASPDGLLHSLSFLRSTDARGPASQLPKLWNLMTKSLSVIFKRTPSWSTYFDNDEMIVWMRDALIYGRDMLAQWRVVENAANSYQPITSAAKTSGNLSKVGAKMVDALQDVLFELVRWLRLTDEELLHQSFSLLESLLELFRDTHVSPAKAALEKLTRHVDDARKDSRQAKSRLDSSRLLRLENALSSYVNDDDDIQIISHSVAPRLKSSTAKAVAKSKTITEPRKAVEKQVQKQKIKLDVKGRPSVGPSLVKASSSKIFTEGDQQKLDRVTLPTFRKTSEAFSNVPPPKKIDVRSRRNDKGPKYEGSKGSAASEESESESDSDDEGTVGGLAALAKLTEPPAIKKTEPRRQIKTLDIPVQKNPMQERLNRRDDIRRAAFRLKPDVSGLHRVLLSWNYDHEGPDPPGNKLHLVQIPDRFSDYNQYRQVFEPLLLLECWAQILQAKEEKQETYECKVGSRQFSDDWLDLDISISEIVRKDWYLAETDIVLLRHATTRKSILAKTQSYRATPHGVQATVRCFTQGGNTDPGLQINTIWKINKVFSLSTLHREYGALVSLPYYDLCNIIFRPTLTKVSNTDQKELQQTMSAYSLNEPQAAAILNALQTEGFALIQGPPGTGKTSTICGLVARFVSKRPRPSVPIHAGRHSGPTEKGPVSKILLCAPSNAAIDEIASRLKDGYRGSEKRASSLKVVRIGAESSMNISVRDISLDYLVDQKLDAPERPSKESGNEIMSLRREIDSVKQARQQKIDERNDLHDNSARASALDMEIHQLNAKRMALTQQFDRMKDKQKSDSRTLDALRRTTRKEVLKEADVICSTLSGAGHEILEDFDFEMVVIDEAAQAIELSSLIPLKYRCTRCVMVGDPQQLPPTVLSQEACRYQYNQSLFVRLQKCRPDAVHLLSIQYRMHPDISCLPSRIFYQGRLQDGPQMDEKTKQPWHEHAKFGTYKFFNISRGIEEQSGRSIKNISECQAAASLYRRLRQEFSSFDFDFRVGVVSMYRAQIFELRRHFEQCFGKDIVGRIDFNTVDGFQGQEKDIIILSCVRAGPGLQTIGFLSDIRRMNVALTRAKSSLYILGNAPTLERSDRTWRDIVIDARSRSSLIEVDSIYFTRPASPTPRTRMPIKKAAATTTSATHTIPSDLVTPSQLKAAIDLNIGSPSAPKQVGKPRNGDSLPTNIPPGTIKEPQRGVKRPAEAEIPVPSTSTTKPRGGDTNTRPMPPPLKRAKQQPNLFIPSKKRPATGGTADPSTNRRKL